MTEERDNALAIAELKGQITALGNVWKRSKLNTAPTYRSWQKSCPRTSVGSKKTPPSAIKTICGGLLASVLPKLRSPLR